jgi:hypothetical protein
MLRHLVAAAVVISASGCSNSPSEPIGAIISGPEVQAAVASCEPKYADHTLTSWSQVAACERDLALPVEQQEKPWLAEMFAGVWSDKIEAYEKVDRGETTKAEADRKIAIEADNWLVNIQSVRRF